MSTIDATFYTCERAEPSARLPLADCEALRGAMAGFATRLVAQFQHRRTIQRIARFSDNRLRDIGFERDWDGSVIPAGR